MWVGFADHTNQSLANGNSLGMAVLCLNPLACTSTNHVFEPTSMYLHQPPTQQSDPLTLPWSVDACAVQLCWACVALTTTLAVVLNLLASRGT